MEEFIVSNLEKYNKAFIETFSIEEKELKDLKYQGVQGWDSVGHMLLIAGLEDAFDIMFDTDDIINFSSFEKGKEILKKYKVEI
jgi:acyl carrier protein